MESWGEIIDTLGLSGIALQLAKNCEMIRHDEDIMILDLPNPAAQLRIPSAEVRLSDALQKKFGNQLRLLIQVRLSSRPVLIDQ